MRTLVNVPCPQCHRDRSVFPCQVTRAQVRVCAACNAATRTRTYAPTRVLVECPNCGMPRELTGKEAARATQDGRQCFGCAKTQAHEAVREAQAYVDEMAVERLLAGMPVNSTRAERQAAVAALTARQVPAWVIAERLRVTERTVQRLRARERQAA